MRDPCTKHHGNIEEHTTMNTAVDDSSGSGVNTIILGVPSN